LWQNGGLAFEVSTQTMRIDTDHMRIDASFRRLLGGLGSRVGLSA
jgi:hypothetical protein